MSNENPNWTPTCPKCGGAWDMMGCDCPPAPVEEPVTVPPPVCTGSWTVPPSLHGQAYASTLDNMAQCGICLQVVRVAWTPIGPSLTVHPYRLVGNVFVIEELRKQLSTAEQSLKASEERVQKLEEQLHRSATVCPKDGCMLWRGHTEEHATREQVSAALGDLTSLRRVVEAARELHDQYHGAQVIAADFWRRLGKVQKALALLDKPKGTP